MIIVLELYLDVGIARSLNLKLDDVSVARGQSKEPTVGRCASDLHRL